MNVSQALGLAAPGWQGRVKPGAYSSPTGVRVPFAFVDVSREIPLRRAEFTFNGLDGSYIQDNGHSARKYPLRCIFSGPEHDRIATQFENSLTTAGVGVLEHPLYGTFPAIPIGVITRRNDLVSEANTTVIEVTFSTTLPSVYPSGQSFPLSEIQASISDFSLAAALAMQDMAKLQTVAQKASFKGIVRGGLNTVRGAFDSVGGVVSTARNSFAGGAGLIHESLDVLVGAPLDLARQVSNLMLAPARLIDGLENRLDGYGRMLDNIVGNYSSTSGDNSLVLATREQKISEFAFVDLLGTHAVAGSSLSVVGAEFTTRPKAQRSAEIILEQLDALTLWRDQRLEDLGQSDTGEAYQALLDAASKAAGYLVDQSFTLVPERQVVLERPRNVLDLCAQLYGTTSSERLDFLISTNDLSGDDIFELRPGSVIRYYV